MNYKHIQFTYMELFKLHHNHRSTNTINKNAFTHKLWSNYLEELREYFVNTEIFINGKKRKILRVDSFGGRLVLSYKFDNDLFSVDLVNI